MRKRGKLGLLGAVGLGIAAIFSGCKAAKEIEFVEGTEGYQFYREEGRPRRGTIESRLAFQNRDTKKELVLYSKDLENVEARFSIEEEGKGNQRKVVIEQTYPSDADKKKQEALAALERTKGNQVFTYFQEGGSSRMVVTDRAWVKDVLRLYNEDGKAQKLWFLGKEYPDPSNLAFVVAEAGKDKNGKPIQHLLLAYDTNQDNDRILRIPDEGLQSITLGADGRPQLQPAVIREEKAAEVEAGIFTSEEEARKKDTKYHRMREKEEAQEDLAAKRNLESEKVKRLRQEAMENYQIMLEKKLDELRESGTPSEHLPTIANIRKTVNSLSAIEDAFSMVEERSLGGNAPVTYIQFPDSPEVVFRVSYDNQRNRQVDRMYLPELLVNAEKTRTSQLTEREKQLKQELEQAALKRAEILGNTQRLEQRLENFKDETEQIPVSPAQSSKKKKQKPQVTPTAPTVTVTIPIKNQNQQATPAVPTVKPTVTPTAPAIMPTNSTQKLQDKVDDPNATKPAKVTSSSNGERGINWFKWGSIIGSVSVLTGLLAAYIGTRKRQ
jgi:hypothetical protein